MPHRTSSDARIHTVVEGDTRSIPSIEQRMVDYAVPGLALTVIQGGAIVHQSAHGVRESGSADPVTTTTLFQACSISKPIVGLAMLRLVDRGELDLDADVNESLTSWRLPANSDWQPRVTLRQLVSHTAGLTTSGFPGYRRDQPIPTVYDVLAGRSPANTFGVRVDTVPGAQFRYSGGGTTVMHQLLEDVTGTPLPELVRKLVLEPLGMADSFYAQPLPEGLHERAASAHHCDGSVVPGGWRVYPELATAGLWTTPGDLARYAIGVQRALAGEAQAILSVDLAKEMLTPVADTGRSDLESIGLGPFLGGTGETQRFGHGGGNEGFKCQLVAYSHTGHGAAVMTNSDNGRVLCFDVLDAVAAAMGWPAWPPNVEEWTLPTPEALDRECGRFHLPSGMDLEVSRDGFDLSVTFSGQRPLTFFQVEDRTFLCGEVDARLTFQAAGEAGAAAATAVTFTQNGMDLECRRLD